MQPLQRLFNGAAQGLAAWYIAAFVGVALLSLHYPFQLEWMEGQTIDIMQRLNNGLPFYAKPSLEYVSFIYTPLYYYVAAFLAKLTVVDFFPARLLSILSTLGTMALLYGWVCKEGGRKRDGLIAAGLFAGTYTLSGRWFDVSRIDNFWVFLTIAALFLLYHYRSKISVVAASGLFIAAFFTKQSALFIIVPALLGMFLIDGRRTLCCGVMAAAGIGIGCAWLEWASEGWFSFYVFSVPAGHGMEKRMIVDFWTKDLARQMGLLCVLIAPALWQIACTDRKKAGFYIALLIGFISCSYISRLHWGGWLNVLIPLHVVLALMAGLSLRYWQQRPQAYVQWLCAALLFAHMLRLFYNPVLLVPTHESAEKGQRFLQQISQVDGDIFMSEIQFVQTRVGKKSYTFGMAGYDVLRAELGDKNNIKEALRSELLESLQNHRFAAVISGRLLKLREKDAYYVFDRTIDYPKEYITGAILGTSTNLYTPRKQQP